MATFIDSDILKTVTPGSVQLLLTCGYGQPIYTSVYLKKIDGSIEKIKEFEGNGSYLHLKNSSELQFNRLEIHSTIHDIRDFAVGQEVVDIKLYEKVFCNDAFVDMEISMKTKGTGQIINCIYEVVIL